MKRDEALALVRTAVHYRFPDFAEEILDALAQQPTSGDLRAPFAVHVDANPYGPAHSQRGRWNYYVHFKAARAAAFEHARFTLTHDSKVYQMVEIFTAVDAMRSIPKED